MMRQTLSFLFGQCVRTGSAGLVLALCVAGPATADSPAPTRAQAHYEVRFMTGMIDHHAMAVGMSELCLVKAVHEELRVLCSQIMQVQLAEISTLQSWLQDWYGISHSTQMPAGMQQRMDRMAQLSSEEFEIEFLKSMIRHHWGAVVSASGCLDRAYHPELIEMCADIVEAQVAEITVMRSWLCQWYGICDYGPTGKVAIVH